MTPPVIPWITRNAISIIRLGAMPQRAEAVVKPATARMRSRFLPTSRASHAVIGRMIALAARYEVSAQVDSSTDAESEPAM